MSFDLFKKIYSIEKLLMIKTEQLIFPIVVKSDYLTSVGISMCAKHLLHFFAGLIVSLFSIISLNILSWFNKDVNILISLFLALLIGVIKEIIDYYSKQGDPKWYGAFVAFLGGLLICIMFCIWR